MCIKINTKTFPSSSLGWCTQEMSSLLNKCQDWYWDRFEKIVGYHFLKVCVYVCVNMCFVCVQSCAFCMCVCLLVFVWTVIFVYAWMYICIGVGGMEVNFGCPSLFLLYLKFWDRVSHWTGGSSVGWTGRPVNSRDWPSPVFMAVMSSLFSPEFVCCWYYLIFMQFLWDLGNE